MDNIIRDKNLENYLEMLMEPKDELSGNSICPFLKKFSYGLKYAHVNSIKDIIDNNPTIIEEMQEDDGSVFIYVFDFDISYDEIVHLWKSEQEKFKDKDIEFLFIIKDDTTTPPLKVLKKYNYDYNSLFVLQRKSTLSKSRNHLAKTTNYYEYWDRK